MRSASRVTRWTSSQAKHGPTDAFWESAKASSQLLVRNGLNTISVWWLPPVVLTFTAGVLSAATGLACGLVFGASAEALRAVAGPGAAGAMIGVGSLALFVGVASFLISLLVLLFLSHLVLNVVDTARAPQRLDAPSACLSGANSSRVHARLRIAVVLSLGG